MKQGVGATASSPHECTSAASATTTASPLPTPIHSIHSEPPSLISRAKACLRCRQMHLACSGERPCSRCARGGHSCLEPDPVRHRRRKLDASNCSTSDLRIDIGGWHHESVHSGEMLRGMARNGVQPIIIMVQSDGSVQSTGAHAMSSLSVSGGSPAMQHHRNSFVSQPTMSRYMPLTPELASAYALNVQNALQSPLSPTLEHLSFSPTLEHPPHITDAGSPVNPFKAAPVCSPHDHEWLGMFSLDDDTTEQLPPRDPPAPMRNPLALRVSTNMPEIAAVSPLHNAFDPDMSRRFVDEEESLLLTPFSASTTHSASTPRFPTSHSFSSCGTSTNCIATGSCSDSRTSTSAASNGKSALKEQLQFLRAQLHLQQFERQSQLDYLGTLEIQLDSMQAAMEDGDMDVVNASADTQESAVAGTIDSEMRQFVHLDAGDTDVTDDMNTAEGNVTVASDDEFDL